MKQARRFFAIVGAVSLVVFLTNFLSIEKIATPNLRNERVLLWTTQSCPFQAHCIGQFNNQYIVAYFSLQLARLLNRRVHYFDIDLRTRPTEDPHLYPFEEIFNVSEPGSHQPFVLMKQKFKNGLCLNQALMKPNNIQMLLSKNYFMQQKIKLL